MLPCTQCAVFGCTSVYGTTIQQNRIVTPPLCLAVRYTAHTAHTPYSRTAHTPYITIQHPSGSGAPWEAPGAAGGWENSILIDLQRRSDQVWVRWCLEWKDSSFPKWSLSARLTGRRCAACSYTKGATRELRNAPSVVARRRRRGGACRVARATRGRPRAAPERAVVAAPRCARARAVLLLCCCAGVLLLCCCAVSAFTLGYCL